MSTTDEQRKNELTAGNRSADVAQHFERSVFLVLFVVCATLAVTLVILWLATTLVGQQQLYDTLPPWMQEMVAGIWKFATVTAGASLVLFFFKGQIEHPVRLGLGILGAGTALVVVVLLTATAIRNIDSSREAPDTVPTETRDPVSDTMIEEKPFVEEMQGSTGSSRTTLADTVETMSEAELRNNFGQIFIVGTDTYDVGDGAKTATSTLLEEYNVGGLIFYDSSLKKLGRQGNLVSGFIGMINRIKEFTEHLNHPPLFLSTDLEGGDTAPLVKQGVVTPIPAAMAIGGTRDLSVARAVGDIVGIEMSALGLNMDFAPVIDVSISSDDNVILDRSYGADQTFVRDMAGAFMGSLASHSVIPVLKHFPGHGGTEAGFESAGVPESSYDASALNAAISPFRTLSDEVEPAIMTSHFRAKSISSKIVTFDTKIISDLLRRTDVVQLPSGNAKGVGFKGLVLADNLIAPSVTGERDQCEKNLAEFSETIYRNTVNAFEAGHDLLMFSHVFGNGTSVKKMVKLFHGNDTCSRWAMTVNEFGEVFGRLKNYVFDSKNESKRHERIVQFRQSLKRIFAYKDRIAKGFGERTNATQLFDIRQKKSHEECAKEIFRRTFVLRRPPAGGAPFFNATKNDEVLVFMPSRWTTYESINELRRDKDGYAEQVAKEVGDYDWPRAIRDFFSNRTNLHFELEKYNPAEEDEWKERGVEIRDLVINEYDADYVVFILNKRVRWGVAQNAIAALAETGYPLGNVTLIVTHHPTMLRYIDPTLSTIQKHKRQAVYVVAYSGYGFRARVMMEALADTGNFEGGASPPIDVPGIFPLVNSETRDSGFSCVDTR